MPLHVRELVEQNLARTTDAMVRAERVGDPVLLFWAASSRARSVGQVGDIDEVDRCLAIVGSLAEQLAQPNLLWWHAVQRATRAMIDAEIDTLEQWVNDALQMGVDSGQPDAFTLFGDQFFQVHWRRGTLDVVIPVLEAMLADAPDVAGIITGGLALAHAETGNLADARRLLDQVAATNFDLPMNEIWPPTIVCHAIAAAACRDTSSAAVLFDMLAPWADRWSSTATSCGAPMGIYAGLLATVLGCYDDADDYFAQASASTDRTGQTFFSAQTGRWWGEMLAERDGPGDLDRARDRLARAQTVAAAHGYTYLERRATEALQRFG